MSQDFAATSSGATAHEYVAQNRLVIRYTIYRHLAGSSDILLCILSGLASHYAYCVIVPGAYGFYSAGSAICVGLVAGLLYVFPARAAGLYLLPSLLRPERSAIRALRYAFLASLLLGAVLFLIRAGADVSRGTLLVFVPLQLALLLANRFAIARTTRSLLTSNVLVGPSVVVLGDRSELKQITESGLMRDHGLREVGRVAINAQSANAEEIALDAALELSRCVGAEKFVVAMPWQDQERLSRVQAGLRKSALPALLLPDMTIQGLARNCLSYPGQFSLRAMELQRAPMQPLTLALKRALDLIIAVAALIIFSPIMVAAAFAIKLDTAGPAIFRQKRYGFDRRPFTILKFRSMTVMEDGHSVAQACKGDARVTRVGMFLRKTSIDELPQLFNVLLGQMSLVGPRPHAMVHDDTYSSLIDRYCFRHHVKPGITGWAQINGARGQTQLVEQMKDRVNYDLWYIAHCSFALDLLILARTCLEVLRHEAY